ncbi:hypothetical protein POPTR_010G039851v4 [Populus trichocarpa]|uniref:Uncharacterized protein n=1 Tax=Populus trichocarpa TaxID=3694 RepID=A0ACC0SAT9_POPTR|nr:hypothetical protein BDE02_10G034100 [Populus trichocarpa]KAI9386544.1 hypothetical protein POPTR_010G039851v4 [Populus trichocarpa]
MPLLILDNGSTHAAWWQESPFITGYGGIYCKLKHIAHLVLSIPFESHSRDLKVVCFEESNASL